MGNTLSSLIKFKYKTTLNEFFIEKGNSVCDLLSIATKCINLIEEHHILYSLEHDFQVYVKGIWNVTFSIDIQEKNAKN